MFTIIILIALALAVGVAVAALRTVGTATIQANEADAQVAVMTERVEQLLWLHQTTINRMNDARTAKEDAETLTRELNAENVKLVKLVMALEAAMAMDYVSNLN